MEETVWIALGAVTAALVAALIARGVKISEFRQAWINALREDISIYASKAHEWIDLYIKFNEESDQSEKADLASELDRLKYDALHVLRRIELRFKVDDPRGNGLLEKLWNLLDPGKLEASRQYASWRELADEAIVRARRLLKEEWEATKNPLRKLYVKESS